MTDAEIIAQLRSLHKLKGWPALRDAADRIEFLSPKSPAARDILAEHIENERRNTA